MEFGLERPETYQVMFMGHGKRIPDGVDPADFPGRKAFDLLTNSIAAGMASETLRAGDPVAAAIGVWGAVHGLTSLLIALPDFPWLPVPQMIDQLCEVQIRGLSGSRRELAALRYLSYPVAMMGACSRKI